MTLEINYIINQHLMCMVGVYDRNGKTCTIVREVNKTFIVDKSPLEILEISIKSIGFNLKGAMATSKWFLGDIHMCPVMVNPILKICLFPIQSAKRVDTMWFNPDHIHRTNSFYRKTNVKFKNGFHMLVNSKLSSFNNKLKIAEQYQEITVEAGKNPTAFLLESKNIQLILSHLLVFKLIAEVLEIIC
ncbi:competence protein ComK [Neobacillus ginsengisoli]|uniref:Competence protein ComK n=1 Tax=Neobacillus ginsengisoli TaxID=904295 RepID=A0ABT9Y273_9BACI|nr:competence protein ComK [Neobacillus ginsengisoli]MDQ0201917.1 competence protein ComK [Neobacillus ginsengisoli]